MGRAKRAVHSESRPNNVKYHGVPAAAKTSSADVPSVSSIAPRSSSERRTSAASPGCADVTAAVHCGRAAALNSRLAPSASTLTVIDALVPDETVGVHRITTRPSSRVVVTSSPPADSARTSVERPSAAKVGTSGVTLPCLTAPTDARSPAAMTLTATVMSRRLSLTTEISSTKPSAVARRERSTRTVGSAIRSPAAGTTPMNVTSPSSPTWLPTTAGSTPSTATTSSARWRTSAWNIPCAPWWRICPSAPESTHVGARTQATSSCRYGCPTTCSVARSGLSFKFCGQGV